MRIADCLWQDMAIAYICHVTVTVCQSEGCIRISVLVGVWIIACMRGTWQLSLSLYLFCVKTVTILVAQTTTRVCLVCR